MTELIGCVSVCVFLAQFVTILVCETRLHRIQDALRRMEAKGEK